MKRKFPENFPWKEIECDECKLMKGIVKVLEKHSDEIEEITKTLNSMVSYLLKNKSYACSRCGSDDEPEYVKDSETGLCSYCQNTTDRVMGK